MNKLLIDDYPIQVLPKLAEKIGLNEAIFTQQLHYWINGKSGKTKDGKRWIYNTYKDWEKQFPFWSNATIRRTINSCEKQKIIRINNYNQLKIDNTKWYTVDYETIKRMSKSIAQNEQVDESKRASGTAQNEQTITIDYPETTTDTKEKSPAKAERIPYKKIIDYLNEKTDKNYSHTAKGNKSYIQARWSEGFRFDDFKKVIDIKVSEWSNDKKMSQYLRPQTLFNNKFDMYRNQYVKPKPKKVKNNNSFNSIESMVHGGGD